MSQSVLIVEDEESAARLIAGICGELGFGARTTRSGREALSLLTAQPGAERPFELVILDLVLAELDGFQVARNLRASAWSAELPLIVVSGVYKQLPADFVAQARPSAFLPKPFEPAGLREHLLRLLRGAQEGAQGELSQKPASAVLVDLLKRKASGTLTMTRGQTVRQLVLQSGQVRFAQSNVKSETAGAAQVASGMIKQAAFDRAVAEAKTRKVPLHEALASSRVFTPEQLKAALRQQTMDVAACGLLWNEGTWRFEAQAPEKLGTIPDLRTTVVSIVSEAARRHGNPQAARSWLQGRAAAAVQRTPELDRELFSIRAGWPGEGVTAIAQHGRTLSDALFRVKEAELPLLFLLCESGLLQTQGGEPVASHPAQPVRAPAPGDEDRGRIFSAREAEVRRLLFAERDRLKDADHYAVLGVERGSPVEDIKTAYFSAAKRFHSDTFSGLDLGSARRVAEDLFRRVSEANAVLTDEKRRAEYDVYIDRKAKGLPTDVGQILKAEGLFLRGEAQHRNGKHDEAETSFREAIALNPTEAEFHAYLGIALYKGKGKAAEALAHVEKALSLDGKLPSALCFAGILHDALGDRVKAKKLLEQALEVKEDHADAQRELQKLKKKIADEAHPKGGVLSRLFKGKGK